MNGRKLHRVITSGHVDVFSVDPTSLPEERASDVSTPLAPDGGNLILELDSNAFEKVRDIIGQARAISLKTLDTLITLSV